MGRRPMKAFDGNDYRKRVMARVAVDFGIADPELGDPFFVCDVDPGASDRDVAERFQAVVAFWQKERGSVKYKGVAAQLVGARERYAAVLLDPAARAAAARRVQTERAAADKARFGELDRLAGQLDARFGGIPPVKVQQLAMLAQRRGLDDALFSGWLSRQKVLADSAGTAEPWDAAIRRQVRSQLDALARLTGDAAAHSTLWTFLDLSPTSSTAGLAARHAELAAENARARYDGAKTARGELLAHVRTRLLVDGGRDAYAASLLADARDLVEPDVNERAIVTGEVSASDYEQLVQRIIGLGWGIGTDDAREVVRSAAAAVGAGLTVAPRVDYVLCGGCRAPQPAPSGPADAATCRYCQEPLYHECPSCAAVAEAAASVCPSCGTSFRAYREAARLIDQARDHLRAGRPVAANAALSEVRVRLGSTRPPAGLDDVASDVAAALKSARAEWEALSGDVARSRLWAAYDRATRLARTAVDVLGPGEVGVAEKLAALAEAKASVQAQVRAASRMPDDEKEAALTRVLHEAVDCPEAGAELARVPLAPPSDIRVDVATDSAKLSWRPAPGGAEVSYRVVRVVVDGEGAATRTTIATTSGTSLEDAGIPGGVDCRYEVTSVAGRRASEPATAPSVFVERDVAALRAEVADNGIRLHWSVQAGAGTVVVERDVAPGSGVTAPTRRIRPTEPNGLVDADVRPGTPYVYRVYVEYRRPGTGLTATAGRTVTARVPRTPAQVRDLAAVTESERTLLSFSPPPAGDVRVYAVNGSNARPCAAPGAFVDTAELERDPAIRLVGTGRRELVDEAAVGRVVYTPVTVLDGRALAGVPHEHLALGSVTDLSAEDTATGVILRFTFPPGATESLVRWRAGQAPDGPDDPVAHGGKVTNSKLEIDGGFAVDLPEDGRAVYVAVYPVVPGPPGTNSRLVGPGETLRIRAARAVQVRYEVQTSGWLRRQVRVAVESRPEQLPAVLLVARAGLNVPPSSGAGLLLASGGGNGTVDITFEVPLDRLPGDVSTLRLFAVGGEGRPVEIVDPDLEQLCIRR